MILPSVECNLIRSYNTSIYSIFALRASSLLRKSRCPFNSHLSVLKNGSARGRVARRNFTATLSQNLREPLDSYGSCHPALIAPVNEEFRVSTVETFQPCMVSRLAPPQSFELPHCPTVLGILPPRGIRRRVVLISRRWMISNQLEH